MLKFKIFLVLLLFGGSFSLIAQDTVEQTITIDSFAKLDRDTAKVADKTAHKPISPDELERMKARALMNRLSANDTNVSLQLNRLADYSALLSSINNTLRRGFDTAQIAENLTELESDLKLAKEGALNVSGRYNYRNLVATRKFLSVTAERLEDWQSKLEKIATRLNEFKSKRDGLRKDSILKKIPADTILRQEYIRRTVAMGRRLVTTDSLLQIAIVDLGVLQNRVFKLYLEIEDGIDEIQFRTAQIERELFKKEMKYLWEKASGNIGLKEDIVSSYEKNMLIFKYYLSYTWTNRFLSLFLVLIFWILTRRARKQLSDTGYLNTQQTAHLELIMYPLIGSLFIVLVMSQFTFADPPEVFMVPHWLLMVICLFYLRFRSLSKQWKMLFLLFSVLFLFALLDNTLLRGSRAERVLILMASIGGVIAGVVALLVLKKQPLISWIVRVNIILLIAQELIAAVANIFGRYTFAKTMMVGGYLNFMAALCLLWWVKLITQFLYVNMEAYRKNDKVNSYIDFEELYNGTKPLFNSIGILAWAIIFLRNLNVFHLLWDAFIHFINEPRNIGVMSFSFGNILVFFAVIYIAVLIAKLVSLLAGHDTLKDGIIRKTKFGNTMLLVRLVIISIGFFIAIGAAGIPFDRITIVLGALGVGIGFGLQGLVNNLVSGIVLAFEKPLVVGDQVEINGKLGLIKEIGFRSSRLSTYEGAEVIIPNGDILSNHVINWTKSNNIRRVELLVATTYGSDLQKVQQVISNLLLKNDSVMKFPEPAVLIHNFNDSSIDFRILFWADAHNFLSVKSGVLQEIDIAFKANGIVIPFPQLVIHRPPDQTT